jgi:hypothetical protein
MSQGALINAPPASPVPGRERRRTVGAGWAWWLAGWLCVATVTAGESFSERDIKAALLVKVAQFVEWPSDAFGGADAPLTMAILGQDPFGEKLEESLRGVLVAGRPVRLTRCRTVAESAGCHVLFVAAANPAGMAEVLKQVAGKPVLTVGDAAGFASDGGMVNFIKDEGRVRLEVNVAAARKAGLRLSAKLVQVARVVGS